MMHQPLFARVYESAWRPFFVSLAAGRPADLERELAWVLEQFRYAEDGLVLDLSCGPGIVGRRLTASGRFQRVYGLDHSRQMLELCVDHSCAEGVEGFELIRADAAALPLGDASLDAVHAGAALHIWPDVGGVLSEVARVLRPGGVFVASTFVERAGWRARGGKLFGRLSGTRIFASGELESLCRAAGLQGFASQGSESMVWLRAERGGEAGAVAT
jgi:SAM-dependent methyltransferase